MSGVWSAFDGAIGKERYSQGATTGTLPTLSNGIIYTFRWTSSTYTALIHKVIVSAGGITAFTAGFATFRLVKGVEWTVGPSGGNALNDRGANIKLRTTYTDSRVATDDIRIADTTGLTVGTVTVGNQNLSSVITSTDATAGRVLLPRTHLIQQEEIGHPLVLGQNEGFYLIVSVPATGTWRGNVTTEWSEMLNF